MGVERKGYLNPWVIEIVLQFLLDLGQIRDSYDNDSWKCQSGPELDAKRKKSVVHNTLFLLELQATVSKRKKVRLK